MNIAIRADGSPFIGMGHVTRMLALAAALRQTGHNVEFFSRFEPGLSRIRSQGFAVHPVPGGLPDGADNEYEPDGVTSALCHLLQANRYDALVTDTYRIDAAYFQQVRPLAKATFYIDDLNRFPVEVDGVINGNINAAELGYDKWPAPVNRWLGCRYNLLRPEFASLPQRETPCKVGNLLIVAGGGDAGNLLVFLANSLLQLAHSEQFRLQLVAPARSAADAALAALVRQNPVKVRIHRDVGGTEMVRLMQQSDLAISAGGSTLYELCATGVPRLAIVLAANQQGIVEAMVRQQLVMSLGRVAALQPALVATAVSRLLNDWPERERMSQQGRKLIDGQGAFRVAHKIEEVVAAAGRSTGK